MYELARIPSMRKINRKDIVSTPPALAPEALYRPCKLDGLTFVTTEDLADLEAVVGQARAREAVELAVGVRRRGYNLYVLGPPGLGKRTFVSRAIAATASDEPAPEDWCYVNNFKQPHRPCALRLPPGCGNRLRLEMQKYIEELRASIPAIFESEEYRTRVEQIESQVGEREGRIFEEVGTEAGSQGLALIRTPGGFSFAPMRNGEVLGAEEFSKLGDEERHAMEARVLALQERLQDAIRQVHLLHKEKRERIRELNREMTSLAVGAVTDELRKRHAGLPQVNAYLDEVEADVLENIDDFRRGTEGESEPGFVGLRASEPPSFRRYTVNVIVGNGEKATGAPIVFEDFPTYQNLLGRIEHVSRLGTLVTDFALIKPGALHRANGGYLLIDAQKLLTQPFAWAGLKRTLASGQIRIESLGEVYSLISTVALEPEPIPLSLKVVIFGERLLYYLLLAYDPEFGELFKVAADFEDELERDAGQEALYAQLVATVVRHERLLRLDRGAVARVIEQASRWVGDSERLSTSLEDLGNLLRESDYCARRAGAQTVAAEHVTQAIEGQRRRSGRLRERIQSAVLRGELMIDTAGERIGVVNGLSVALVGDHAFAHPTRITATTRLGDGEIIDIQREVELGGPIHSKGVLILASYLASRYSGDRPHALSASLSFEQTYAEVEGDSASVAELAALLSSLAAVPIRQSLAVTGSVNQYGEVQPIGGVNEKIEGYFDICQARGLSGQQGVIIPATNVRHLMLRADVVQAAREGRFHIYPIGQVDEAMALLTGVTAGEMDGSGVFPKDSINARVAARLTELSLMRQAYANMPVRVKTVRGRKKAPAAPPREKPGR
ncbi:MAG: Lon protease [Gammaproteobacteria bacterium]|nr:Lon protease [Gammaproteobacteria bacterium]